MFRLAFASILLACGTSAVANVLWDESVNGDISGVFGEGPIFNLANGDNFVTGSLRVDIGNFDFDVFSILIPVGTTLNSISLVPGYTSTEDSFTVRWRVREGAQVGNPFLTTVSIGPLTTAQSVAADVAAIPLDRAALTFNSALAFSGQFRQGPDFSYTWIYNAIVEPTGAIPEPGVWAMLISGFGLVGFAMRRRGNGQGKSVSS